MRSFAVGVVVGAGVCFAVIRIVGPQPVPIQCEQLPDRTQPRSEQPACPDVANVSPAPSTAAAISPPQADVPAMTANRCMVEQLTEKEANTICMRSHELRAQSKQAAKDAEPKDPGWAYQMEIMIRQHMEAHVPANQYTKMQIECRTTFCELKMEGGLAGGQTLASKVAHEIMKQPWSDLAPNGQAGGSAGDQWNLTHEWVRMRTEAERRFWRSQMERQ